MDIEFLSPDWLWLSLPLIILFGIKLKFSGGTINADTEKIQNVMSVRHPYAQDEIASYSKKTNSKSVLYPLLSGFLLLLALAEPVSPGRKISIPDTSADILLIIDTSISMVVKDYQLDGKRVDRMTMMKVLIERFSEKFSGQRIGIIIVGDLPQFILKPTKDKNLVSSFIHRLKPTIAGRQAALGDAVAIATDYIKAENKPAAETVLVLISDGVKPSGKLSPLEGAKRVAKAGLILYTIAIGSSAGRDALANEKSTQGMGDLIFEAADLKLLQQMAKLTGGESYHGSNVTAIDQALKNIEKRHKVHSDDNNISQIKNPLYMYPLLLVLIMFVIKDLFIHLIKVKNDDDVI